MLLNPINITVNTGNEVTECVYLDLRLFSFQVRKTSQAALLVLLEQELVDRGSCDTVFLLLFLVFQSLVHSQAWKQVTDFPLLQYVIMTLLWQASQSLI